MTESNPLTVTFILKKTSKCIHVFIIKKKFRARAGRAGRFFVNIGWEGAPSSIDNVPQP